MSLTERIKEIRLILHRPYFYVNLSNQVVMIVFESEDDNEPRFTFTGSTLKTAVEAAETWIEHERKVGSLKEHTESELEKPEQEPEEPKLKEEDSENKDEG